MAQELKPPVPTDNHLIASLPPSTRKRIIADCEEMKLGLKHILYEPNEPITNVYFPLSGVMSMVSPLEDGQPVEVATTGNEGMVGLPVFLGVDRTPLKAFSQVPGVCLRLSSTLFRKHLEHEPDLVALLHRYTQVLMMQISQGTACNRAHSIEQRCSRWLLMTHDRVNTREFALTQEFLGQMLGVRRASVNEVASKLQDEKLIRYTRGTVSVLNRRGLETLSCACYWIVRTEYERILGGAGNNNNTKRKLARG